MTTIGLIGCGAIGSRLAREIQRQFKGQARVIGIYDKYHAKAVKLSRSFRPPLPILSLQKLFERCQLLIEAASPAAVGQLLPYAISRK